MNRGWRARAACRDSDPELFFPTATSGPVFQAQVTEAKAVCADCPVQAECLAEALERLPHGVAGGLTDQERQQLRGRSVAGPAEVRRAKGRRLLAAGRPAGEVARRCEVSERTAQRWATRTPNARSSGVAS